LHERVREEARMGGWVKGWVRKAAATMKEGRKERTDMGAHSKRLGQAQRHV
jgi:hypothetical protein